MIINTKERKRILIVYPHNFFEDKSGINSRYIALLKYFKSRNFDIDIFAIKNFRTSWDNYPSDLGDLADRVFFYDFNKGNRWQSPKNRKKNPLVWLKRHIPFLQTYTDIPNFAFRSMRSQLTEILEKNTYHFILISYIFWADLIRCESIPRTITSTILDLSDFTTLNRFDSSNGDIKIGKMIEDEIHRVNHFDHVMCISYQEKSFFSQFATSPSYYYVPYFMEENESSRFLEPRYDILFIGSDNIHNVNGMKWFFQEIHPRLFTSIRVAIAGSITQYVGKYDNVTCISSVENLDELYRRSRIAICPLIGGTGMKVKIVEALSYGLPVVTTTKGFTGFPCHKNTGCIIVDCPAKFARQIHILLSDKAVYDHHHQLAQTFFKENFEKSVVYRQLDEIFINDLSTMDTKAISIRD